MAKKRGTDVPQPTKLAELTDELVIRYLEDNPNFFMRNAQLIDGIEVPHAIHGTVSLVEWQLKRQRERINQLEEEITLLFERAHENEALFNQLLSLVLSLNAAEDLDDFFKRLVSWTRKLGLSHVVIRLFDDTWSLQPPFEFVHLGLTRQDFESIRINKLCRSKHFLGQLNPTELSIVLTERTLVGSVALSLLNELDKPVTEGINAGEVNPLACENRQMSGLIMFVSPNIHHFKTGMDTALLDKISEFLPNMLARFITRKN